MMLRSTFPTARRLSLASRSSFSSFKLPPPTWSLKDLHLTADEPISEAELQTLAKRALIDLSHVEDTDGLRQDMANMMSCLDQVHAVKDLPELSDVDIYDAPRQLSAAPVRSHTDESDEAVQERKNAATESKQVWESLLHSNMTQVGGHKYFVITTKQDDKA